MQFLKWPFLMLWRAVTFGANVSQISSVADRVDRHGDRFRNANNVPHAHLADEYAGRIRRCFAQSGALSLEEDFLVAVGLKQRTIRPDTPGYEPDTTWPSGGSRYTPSSYGGSGYRPSSDYSSDSSQTSSSDSSDSPGFAGGGGESGGGGASGSWDTDAADSGASADNATDNS